MSLGTFCRGLNHDEIMFVFDRKFAIIATCWMMRSEFRSSDFTAENIYNSQRPSAGTAYDGRIGGCIQKGGAHQQHLELQQQTMSVDNCRTQCDAALAGRPRILSNEKGAGNGGGGPGSVIGHQRRPPAGDDFGIADGRTPGGGSENDWSENGTAQVSLVR
jgi:hypothetical protein